MRPTLRTPYNPTTKVMRELMTLVCKSILVLFAGLTILGPFLHNASAQQSGTANISGVVKDSNGAVVTEAQLSVTQKATAVSREAVTNSAGFFVISNLAPGVYELKVHAKGFAD